jgi:hypothetical protein
MESAMTHQVSGFATNRAIRRAYRKRLLPRVEQCLLGRGVPIATHHTRHSLDRQTASEILACFEGHTWLADYTVEELLALWDDRVRDARSHPSGQQLTREQGTALSIGNFVGYLYEEQVAYDENVRNGCDELKPTVAEQHERRMALLATLYISGYLPKFEPESLLELT